MLERICRRRGTQEQRYGLSSDKDSVAFLSEPVKGKPHLRWGGSFASGSESWNSERQLTITEGDDQKTITDSIGKQKEDILNFLSVLCSFGGQIWLELYYSRNKQGPVAKAPQGE